jgi:hypothetical protein
MSEAGRGLFVRQDGPALVLGCIASESLAIHIRANAM